MGGTGFVGSHLVKRLLKNKNYKIRCLVRDAARNSNDIEFFKGDILDRDSLIKATKNIDIVIHLVGIIRETKNSKFYDIHYLGTKNLIEACKKNKVKKFIFFSALGSHYQDTDYFKTKFMAEQEIKKSRITYTIFRPSIIFGKEDKSINMFANITKRFPVVLIPKVKGKFQPIYVEDIVKCVIKSLNNKKTNNKIFEIGGPENLKLEEIFKKIANNLKLKRIFIKIPYQMILSFVSIFEPFFQNFPITRDQLKMLNHDITCRNLNYLKIFNIKFKKLDFIREYI